MSINCLTADAIADPACIAFVLHKMIPLEVTDNFLQLLLQSADDDLVHAQCRMVAKQLRTWPIQAAIFPSARCAWTLERRYRNFPLMCMEFDAAYELQMTVTDDDDVVVRSAKVVITTTRHQMTVTPFMVSFGLFFWRIFVDFFGFFFEEFAGFCEQIAFEGATGDHTWFH